MENPSLYGNGFVWYILFIFKVFMYGIYISVIISFRYVKKGAMILERKIALITGASSGFGFLTTLALARNGYRVIATMRDLNKSKQLLEEARLESLEDLIDIHRLDVTDQQYIPNFIKEVTSKYQKIDILINNAGYCEGGLTEELTMELWKKQFDTNLFGMVQLVKECLPYMRDQGAGKIINISSVAGTIPLPAMSAYVSSKFAVEGFTKSLAMELVQSPLEVYLIQPGPFDTSIWDNGLKRLESEKIKEYGISTIQEMSDKILRSTDKPEKVAELIVRLCQKKRKRVEYPVGKRMGLVMSAYRHISFETIFSMIKIFLKSRKE